MKYVQLKSWKKCWIQVMIILIFTIPVIATCFYIMPAADDFGNAVNMKRLLLEHRFYLTAALEGSKNLYWETSGYFFAAFLNLFFSPLLRGGTVGVRFFCIIVNLLLYITLYFFVKMIMSYWLEIAETDIILWLYVLVLFCFTNIHLNVEATFWYCVMAAYVLVFIIMLWGVMAFMKALKTGERKWGIIAAVFGFLVSGSSLNVTALNCFVYLLIAIYGFFELGQKRKTVFCFGSAFLGGIVNLLSPGNYARHDTISSNYNIISAVSCSIKLVVMRFYHLLSNTLYPIIVVLLLFIFLMIRKKVKTYKYLNPILLIIILAGALTVLAFPVYLGYGTDAGFPKRCYFVQDSALYLFSFIIILYTSSWIKEKWGEFKFNKQQLIIGSTVLCLFFCTWHSGRILWDTYPALSLTKRIVSGANEEFSKYWQDILEEIADKEGNVVVVREPLNSTSALLGIGVSEDEKYWVNQVVAGYYGKETVKLVLTKEENEEE